MHRVSPNVECPSVGSHEVFEVTINDENKLAGTFAKKRNMNPLRRLCGFFLGEGSTGMSTDEITASFKATKVGKYITLAVLGVVAAGTGLMLYANNQKSNFSERQWHIHPKNTKRIDKTA